MTKRLFKYKKRNFNFNFIFLIIFVFLIVLLFYQNLQQDFFIIAENKKNFYIIPKDKGGEKVLNTDKKSLNLNININNNIDTDISTDLLYSIQFSTNSDFNNISKYLEKLTSSKENIFLKENFYILSFNTNIGIEYFLLYKNFETSKKAYNYCIKYLNILDQCLIVDVKKFKF